MEGAGADTLLSAPSTADPVPTIHRGGGVGQARTEDGDDIKA